MVYEVVWTPKALESFRGVMEYLQNKWTLKEQHRFAEIVEEKIISLSLHPEIGKSKSKINKDIRQAFLHKRVLLIYRNRHKTKIVELLLFWNTYQHPARLKLK